MSKHQLHIPRTGGTELRRLLERNGYTYHSHYDRLQDIGDGDIVVCLRDPVERFISLYSLMVNAGNDIIPRMDDFVLYPERFKLAVEYDRWGYLYNPQTWWVESAEELIRRNVTVLRTENLVEDVQRELGLTLPPFAGVSRKQEATPEVRKGLAEIYEEDYELLRRLANERRLPIMGKGKSHGMGEI